MQVWNLLHTARWKTQDAKKSPKIAIWAPSHKFVGLYLRNSGTYRQSEKNAVKQPYYVIHMSPQYGELRPTSSWDRFASLGHPYKFQWVLRLGSVTARQSSTERQPNFAASNRGRHLCLAGRPSRWALAHISSLYYGLDVCPLNRDQVRSLEFAVNSCFRKIFSVRLLTAIEKTVKCCLTGLRLWNHYDQEYKFLQNILCTLAINYEKCLMTATADLSTSTLSPSCVVMLSLQCS